MNKTTAWSLRLVGICCLLGLVGVAAAGPLDDIGITALRTADPR